MTPVQPPEIPDDEPVAFDDLTRQALYWVIRLTSGEASTSEIEAFRTWRDDRPEHAQALAEARRYWLILGQVDGDGAMPETDVVLFDDRARSIEPRVLASRRSQTRRSPRYRTIGDSRKIGPN